MLIYYQAFPLGSFKAFTRNLFLDGLSPIKMNRGRDLRVRQKLPVKEDRPINRCHLPSALNALSAVKIRRMCVLNLVAMSSPVPNVPNG